MAEEELLTMDEAIKRLSTTRGTFYRWLRGGKIKGFKVGRQWRFREDEIERFLSGEEPSIDLPVNPGPLVETLEAAIGDVPDRGDMDRDSVAYVVQLMLICGVKKGARSLFIDAITRPATGEGVFSLRIDGVVRQIASYDIRLNQPIVDRVKQISGMDVTDKRKPQDGRIHFQIGEDRWIFFVVSTMPSTFGECCTLMVRDPRAATISLDLLGLEGANLSRVEAALARKQGLFIASGPAESGKQATSYSMLNAIGVSDKRVVSIDEPGSITVPGVIQTVAETFGVDVNDMIRAASRQNWDVLNIGYIQNAETLALAMHEALSGLVIASIHFKDAISGLITIREWGTEGLLMSDALALIASQRLARRLCEQCKTPIEELADEDKQFMDQVLAMNGQDPPEGTFGTAVGCEACHDGYLGRIGLFETLVPSLSIESALMDGANYRELRAIALGEGMETLCLDGIRKAARGVTSIREVRRVAGDLVDASPDAP